VNVRRATESDEAVLHELWAEFEAEIPFPFGPGESWEDEWRDVRRDIDAGGVFVAEDETGVLGTARITAPFLGAAKVHLVHVRPEARRRGVAKALLRECVADAKARGADHIKLDVLVSNEEALVVWRRLGFEPVTYELATALAALETRLETQPELDQHATTHAQTDDEQSVGRAIAQFIPRLESPDVRRAESWIRVADPVLDRDREARGRFARELSERLGAVTVALAREGEVVRFRLYERGRMVDEYLSVPTYYGPLPKGDELALAANPTLVSRLTGADRDEVKRVAVNAASPAELPPAAELYEEIARMMGLEP
jgi:ribosomal protein S18 acetylase RimI-like enzyme